MPLSEIKFSKDNFGKTYIPIICPAYVFVVNGKDLWLCLSDTDLYHYLMYKKEWVLGVSKMEEKTEKYWHLVDEILIKNKDVQIYAGQPIKLGVVL